MKYLELLWTFRWEVVLLATIFIYGQRLYRIFIFDPIAGGNGKVQMDELVKAVLTGIIVYASVYEGKTAEQVYPDVFWFSIFGCIAVIAGIKRHYNNKYVHDHNKKSDSDASSGSATNGGSVSDNTGES